MIGIVDYGMGNLRSVQKAFEKLGHEAIIADTPTGLTTDASSEIDQLKIDRLVLPGVGAFADGMAHLRERGWIDFLTQYHAANKPMLGICLGMQLLFDSSEEDAPSPDDPVQGLGFVAGQCVRFQEDQGENQPRLKVPHMGWNSLNLVESNGLESKATTDPLMNQLTSGCHVYFVHGYHCRPADPNVLIATTDYGQNQTVTAAIRQGNLWATQFHPEKSQDVGLTMLNNFATM